MGAVWMVRSRQMFTSFRFWLALFGYNPRDHSFSQKLYLVYAAIFYLLWTFAVLSLFAGGAAQVLAGLQNLLGSATPEAASGGIASGAVTSAINIAPAASLVGWLGLVIWWLIATYTAARRSPLNFSEEDAYLICQTPADRRAVALAWLVGQWPASLLPIGTLAIILGFSLVEGAKRGFLTTADIPFYLLSGLRSVSIIVPLQIGLLALAWTPGVIRLRRGRERAWVRLVSPAIGLILLLAWLASNSGGASLLSPSSQSPLAFLAAPLMYPLQAALGLVAWPNGALAALAWAAAGLLVMLAAATRLNLSRAAQESRGQITLVQTLLAGDARQVEVFKMQQRLGTQRQPSSWLTAQAWAVRSQKRTWLSLVLKDLAQSARTNPLTRLWNWLSTFLIGAGLVLSTALRSQDWALAAILLVYWSLQIGNQATKRLRDDLAQWSLLRPLPLGYKNLIAAEIMLSWIEASLVSWLGLALGVGMYALIRAASAGLQAALPAAQPLLQPGGILSLILLAPILVGLAIFGATLDVLRQSKSSNLLSGYAPQPGVLSVILGGGAVLISALLAYSLAAFSPWLAVLAPLASAGLARLLWEAAAQRYAGIK